MPNFKAVFLNVFQQAEMFLKRAGTVILAISIILWALAYFPKSSSEQPAVNSQQTEFNSEQTTADSSQTVIDDSGAQLRNSYAGQLGQLIEPVIAPLGFDWKIGVALIASFAAREVLVSTLSIIYNVGKDETEESQTLMQAVRDAKREDGTPAWTPLTALTLMVFFVLAIQCMSTVAVTRRETNSWAWAIFMVAYMTILAYVAALITYQGGRLLGFG